MNKSTRGWKGFRTGLGKRLLSLALTALTLCSLFPGLAPEAEAAEWMEPYLEKLVDWGVMRGNTSGDLSPDRVLTRAEFVTMINRAFGYTERGTTPFQDVPENAWYADDINIAYQAGYFSGTSETTANPLGRVTREQAAVLLGRNLRLQGVPGVNSDFSDVYQMGNWSRGLIQECADLGIIQGYADGTFRPRNYITRGQMACFLVRALGTLVHEPGDQIAGGVYGNLTVNTSGVKLRDTVVTGNLYLSGGVGLGSVELENVTVMGRIVVCGAGEAQKGQSSIILRNVTAEAMEIDSLSDHFMTVRTEGLTSIANTTVRTSAYLEDVTDDDQGLRLITLDGTSDGTQLQLAGNIKEVINITPNSDLQVVQGVTDKLTVDERATGSALSIANDTAVRILNLDVATPVTGNGDVSKMNINAAGSSATMLPDTIFVRPGINANIHNQVMDNVAAEESSDEPRLLTGYPLVRNLASTSADAVFSTNKRGTLYWAVSALLDGSVGEDELRTPSAYPGKVLKSGTINVTASKTEMTARLTGLTREGSYYISAMLVDERGHTSPVKVTAFTTTDDSTPAFAAGYPEAILTVDPNDDQEQIIQARVMATKTCQLYYALLPRGSTAPTSAALRSGAVTGNLGYGVMEVSKNRSYLISRVNTAHLAEQTTYDLYFWLNDADNGKSSAVQRVQVTTKDMTPPVVTNIYQSKTDRTSAQITFSMSERADLYWVAVKAGETLLRPVVTGQNIEPTDLAAKVQVEAGGGNAAVVNSGRTTAAQADTNYTFTINRLEEQGVYDLYYVAKDPAGNYSHSVLILEDVMTSDGTGPKVEVTFSRYNEGANGVINPWVESDVSLAFSEIVQGTYRDGKTDYYDDFYKLYEDVAASSGTAQTQAKNALAAALRKYITLYPGTPPTSGNPRQDPVTDNNGTVPAEELETLTAWIDFREAVVTRTDGKVTVTFPGNKGIKMQSGGTYFFRVEDIVDASGNPIDPNPTYTPQGGFTTAFATVRLKENQNEETVEYPMGSEPRTAKIFQLSPEDTQAVPEDTRWDMLLWTDSSIDYQLLVRMVGDTSWFELGTARPSVTNVSGGKVYSSLSGNFSTQMINSGFFGELSAGQGRPFLSQFAEDLEFAIVPVETSLEKVVNMEVQLYAGSNTQFSAISIQQGQASTLVGRDITAIGEPDPFPITISPPGRAPTVSVRLGGIDAGEIAATVQVQLDRQPGTVFYMAVPIEKDADGNTPESGLDYVNLMNGPVPKIDGEHPYLEEIPSRLQGASADEVYPMWLDSDSPDPRQVIRGAASGDSTVRIRSGSSGMLRDTFPHAMQVVGLEPDTTYILYLATTDENGTPSDQAMCLKFTTDPPSPPKIEIVHHSYTQAEIKTDKPATISYVLVNTRNLAGSAFATVFSTLLPTGTTLPAGFPADGTVLDAMIREYNVGGRFMGSIFDNFTDTTTKETYAELIRQSESMDGAVMASPNQYIQSTTRPFNLSGMQGRDTYALLVVARGDNSESDGFRASRYYRNVNAEYLYITEGNCFVSANKNNADPDNSYSGTLTIIFNSNKLYFNLLDGSETVPEVDACEIDKNGHLSATDNIITGSNGIQYKNIRSFMSYGSETAGMTTPAPNTNHAEANVGNTLTFDIVGASADTMLVSFGVGLCGENGAVRNKSEDAILTVILRKVVNGTTVTWRAEYTDAWHRATD